MWPKSDVIFNKSVGENIGYSDALDGVVAYFLACLTTKAVGL